MAAVAAVVVLAFTIYSLSELHRVSTDQAESDNKQFFATEFKSAGSVVKRAFLRSRSSLGTTEEGPPIERLGQCIMYRNTELCEWPIKIHPCV
jgi:hypothetical protein